MKLHSTLQTLGASILIFLDIALAVALPARAPKIDFAPLRIPIDGPPTKLSTLSGGWRFSGISVQAIKHNKALPNAPEEERKHIIPFIPSSRGVNRGVITSTDKPFQVNQVDASCCQSATSSITGRNCVRVPCKITVTGFDKKGNVVERRSVFKPAIPGFTNLMVPQTSPAWRPIKLPRKDIYQLEIIADAISPKSKRDPEANGEADPVAESMNNLAKRTEVRNKRQSFEGTVMVVVQFLLSAIPCD